MTGRVGWVVVGILVAGGGLDAQPVPAQFRGGPAHAGVVDTRGVERLGGLAWTFGTDGPVRGSPTVADGVVHVGSTDGRLYALDAADGTLRWSYDAGAPLGGAPLVTEALVVVAARGNTVHAVDRRTGRRAWRVATGPDLPLAWGHEGWDYLLPSPVLAGGTVLVGSGDGHLYALDPATGAERWRFRTAGRIRGAPAVVDGVAYVGSGDGVVYGVRVADGRETWRFETAGMDMDAADFGFDRTQIQASPAVVDGTLYIGSRDASLYAIDLSEGSTRWTLEDGSAWVVASVAVRDGRVFSGRSSGGRFRAIEATRGAELWVRSTGGLVFSSPTVVDGTVYVGSGSGRLLALDAATGDVRWSLSTGGAIVSSPAVWEGRVYVGSDDGTVYAAKAADGPAPRLAVYWDEAMRGRSLFGSSAEHRRVAAHFEEAGYELLDGAALTAFLTDRVADGAPSVVVFGMDGLPEEVAGPTRPELSLLRRYLEGGGKAVWPALPPLAAVRNDDGRVTGFDRARPTALLGVDHSAWDTDTYGVTITREGMRWGLATPFLGSPYVAADEASVVLARDELGRAAAWVRSFGGPVGTGWVVVPATTHPDRLREMRLVAEYGIFRPAPAR
ncbi:MAG: PQQ-binding-like beta-propeller repeat protein [Longimicrobiales bacterium]